MGTRNHIVPRLIAGLLAALVIMTSAPAAFAETAQADARAVALTPLTVTKTQDLRFGNIIPGTSGGTVFINTRNGVRSSTGGVTLVGADFGRAAFQIYGGPNQLVTVTIPGTMTIAHANGVDTMGIAQMAIGNGGNNFNTFVFGNLGVLGVYQFTVGGRLTVPGSQQTGLYEGSFIMTVNYL